MLPYVGADSLSMRLNQGMPRIEEKTLDVTYNPNAWDELVLQSLDVISDPSLHEFQPSYNSVDPINDLLC